MARADAVKPKDGVVPGKVLPIDKYLTEVKPRNRVLKIGLEIEGAWIRALPPGTKIERDGSVFKNMGDPGAGSLKREQMPGYTVGEITLGPYQPILIPKLLTRYWPDKYDESCGLHIHMSFEKVLHYVLLANTPDYQETLIHYLDKWGKEEGLIKTHQLFDRLSGNSIYCQKKFWPSEQMWFDRKDHDQVRYGHRYTMVNYPWKRWQTVECRILPMFETKDQSIRALKRVIDITNAFLLVGEKRRKIVPGEKIQLETGDIYEEIIETKL